MGRCTVRNNQSKSKYVLWLVCLIALTGFPMIASADVPYRTFTEDSYERTIMTQSAYSPVGVLAQEIPVVNEKGEVEYTSRNGLRIYSSQTTMIFILRIPIIIGLFI